MAHKYYLKVKMPWRDGEEIEKEVSLEEYRKAERGAEFRYEMSSADPRYMMTPATAGFSSGSISGHINYNREDDDG